jgi:TetR/AcrR family transcriptional regulator, ethionamide resistance regulator
VTPREGPPTAKRAAIQAAVLDATEQLLAEGASYADLNIERIATRAGISRTAFYFYFADKRDLLMRLTEDVSALLYGQAEIWWSGQDDPEPEIRQAFTNIAALYREHGVLIRAVVEVSTYDEEIGSFWRNLLAGFVEQTSKRIVAEQKAGRAPAMNAHATAFALSWMVERTLYQRLVQGEPFSDDELVDALSGVYMRTVYGR